jgi:hypothetical protein
MKKILYSLLVAGLILTGCTKFDDEASKNYGTGPDVAISLTTTADSTFTFTLSPATGTQFYSYVVLKGDAVDESIDATDLLREQYKGVVSNVLKAANNATFTEAMRNLKTKDPLCSPNTSYVIYAVACNDKGVCGKIASQVVLTKDGVAPFVKDYAEDTANKNVAITFSENVTAGTGKVTAKYFATWSGKFTDVPETDITTTVESNIVTVSTPKAPAGAYVLVSMTAGAFKDSYGNNSDALTTGLNAAGDNFDGIFYRVDTKDFNVPDSIFSSIGKLYTDYTAFQDTATFENNIYRDNKNTATGDVSVIYKGANKTTTIGLTADQWNAVNNMLIFTLPESPVSGDQIFVSIKKGVLFDEYGNSNTAFTSKKAYWNFYKMQYGTYNLTITTSKGTSDLGTITIEKGTEANKFTVKNIYIANSEVPGYFDPSTAKLYIASWSNLGIVNTYAVYAVNYSDTQGDWIDFNLGAGGKFQSSDFGLAAFNSDDSFAGWMAKATTATITPITVSASASAKVSNSTIKALSVKAVSAKRLLKAHINNKALRR